MFEVNRERALPVRPFVPRPVRPLYGRLFANWLRGFLSLRSGVLLVLLAGASVAFWGLKDPWVLRAEIPTGWSTVAVSTFGRSPATFSPDGRRVIAPDEGGSVGVYDADTGRCLRRLPVGGGQTVTRVIVSPDGRWIAAESVDIRSSHWHTRCWDAHSGAVQFSRADLAGAPLAFAPDGEALLIGSHFGEVETVDPRTGARRRKWDLVYVDELPDGAFTVTRPIPGSVQSGWYCAGGQTAVIVAGESVFLCDAADGRQRETVVKDIGYSDGRNPSDFGPWLPDTDTPPVLAVSPDGYRFLDREARVWDVQWRAKRWRGPQGGFCTLTGADTGAPCWAAFSPDGKRVVLCGHDSLLRQWDATTGEPIVSGEWGVQRPGGHLPYDVLGNSSTELAGGRGLPGYGPVAYSPDGRRIAVGWLGRGPARGGPNVIDAENGRLLARLSKRVQWQSHLAFSADGRRLLALDQRGLCRVFERRWDESLVWLGAWVPLEAMALLSLGLTFSILAGTRRAIGPTRAARLPGGGRVLVRGFAALSSLALLVALAMVADGDWGGAVCFGALALIGLLSAVGLLRCNRVWHLLAAIAVGAVACVALLLAAAVMPSAPDAAYAAFSWDTVPTEWFGMLVSVPGIVLRLLPGLLSVVLVWLFVALLRRAVREAIWTGAAAAAAPEPPESRGSSDD